MRRLSGNGEAGFRFPAHSPSAQLRLGIAAHRASGRRADRGVGGKVPGAARERTLIAQLDVPVGEIDEMPPALMLLAVERNVDKRSPFRTLRFANERHVRLVREPIAFARIARDARANDVLPRREAAFVAWQNVIEIQLLALENFSAVPTGVVVAFEDVVPGKLHFLLRQPIKKEEDDDARHPDFPRDGGDHLVLGLRRGDGKVEPAREIVRGEIVLLIGRDDLRVSLVEKGKSTTRRADIHRLPKAIEHQNLTVKYGVQRLLRAA